MLDICNPPNRIMIFGRPGSGKSTFAKRLHEITKLPLYHLDKHYFLSNWVERNKQEFLDIQQSLVIQDRWIIDGNSIKSLEMRYSKTHVALYINFPKWVCIYRILKIIFFPNANIDDRAKGCTDRLNWKLLEYCWTFDKRIQKSLAYLKEKYPKVHFIEITNCQMLKSTIDFFKKQEQATL
ncbi:MAG: DNA topology modulation protein [Pseudomonadota bacterium]|nr:DNA topology modulation protein [Alphaproteobacteria bacterium]